jgi:predicted DNA-binding transcriptional regulator AlpA
MTALANIPSELNRERLLDTEQTAEFLGMSIPHLRRLYRSGKVPKPIRIGERKYSWPLGGLIDFVSAKTQKAAA